VVVFFFFFRQFPLTILGLSTAKVSTSTFAYLWENSVPLLNSSWDYLFFFFFLFFFWDHLLFPLTSDRFLPYQSYFLFLKKKKKKKNEEEEEKVMLSILWPGLSYLEALKSLIYLRCHLCYTSN
jgi:hypothetical protein